MVESIWYEVFGLVSKYIEIVYSYEFDEEESMMESMQVRSMCV